MNWVFILFAVVALAFGHLLRVSNRSSLLLGFGTFLAGLIASIALVRVFTERADIVRATGFDGILNHGLERAAMDDAPIIVFSGASYSRNGIDADRLTTLLRARGYPHRVINLSMEAGSLMERREYIELFMERSPKTPDTFFIEIAHETDYKPAFIFGNSKFSNRAINQFDVNATAWTLAGFKDGGCVGLADCIKQIGLLGAHAVLNTMNIGVLSQGEPRSEVDTLKPYEGPTEARDDIPAGERNASLSAGKAREAQDGPNWALSVRQLQREYLSTKGVEKIGYYFPPVVPEDLRTYSASLCEGELSAFTCIVADDPTLLAKLDQPVWQDRTHLLADGAKIYGDWLIEELIASGILGPEEIAP